MKDKLLSIPLKLKLSLSNDYSFGLKNERLNNITKQVSDLKDWEFKTVIDEKIDKFKTETNVDWDQNFIYSGVNVSLGNDQRIETVVSHEQILNQLSMTNVVISSKEYISSLLGSPILDSRKTVNYPILSKIDFLQQIKKHMKSESLNKEEALVELLLSLDKIKENIKDEYRNYAYDFHLSDAEENSTKDIIVGYVNYLNNIDLDIATHNRRYMASINNLHTINDCFNAIKEDLDDLLLELSFFYKRMLELCSKINILNAEVDFIFVDKSMISTTFDVHFTSFFISEFIENSFLKLKEIDEMEGVLNDADNKINYFSSLNVFSSSDCCQLSHEVMNISMKYRTKLNLCIIYFEDIDYLSRLEYKDRIGFIVFDWYANYVLDKCFRSKLTSKFFLGIKKLDIHSIYVSNKYNIHIY